MSKQEHKHSAWQCPTHCRNCGCKDPDNSICNPYYINGHCPEDLNWLPEDDPKNIQEMKSE